jgi:serine protease AprX
MLAALIAPATAALPRVLPGQQAGFARALAASADTDPFDALVGFRPGTSVARQHDLLSSLDLKILDRFSSADFYYVGGLARSFRTLTTSSSVRYLEMNRQLQFHGDTGPWATRARAAYESAMGGPYQDAQGAVINGAGVGVAVVDGGIWAVHPDLKDRVVKNWKYFCPSIALENTQTHRCYGGTIALGEVPGTSDWTSGHGTHVSGIIAGTGAQSNGFYRGVAPGASLYGFGVGETAFVAAAAEAFEFIVANAGDASVFPVPVKVVNNSWGDEGVAYDPNSLLSVLTHQLIDKGLTVVFSAGNAGGTGTTDATSSTCDDPTPGVICVANYDDLGSGSRTSTLDASSSRGLSGQASTYPDISAPGALIASTCTQHGALCNTAFGIPTLAYAPFYSVLSGTSMASPHIAGIVALMLQADPTLTSTEIEDLLQDTAFKVPPTATAGTISFDKGAGLADVPAILEALGTAHGSVPLPGEVQTIATDQSDPQVLAGAADILSLKVQEEADGLRYFVEVRDGTLPPNAGVTYALHQCVDGNYFVSRVLLDGTGAHPVTQAGTLTPPSATFDAGTHTLSIFFPFSTIGDPDANSPAYDVRVEAAVPSTGTPTKPPAPLPSPAPQTLPSSTLFGTRVDIAPGQLSPAFPAGLALNPGERDMAEPMPVNGAPFTVSRAVTAALAPAGGDSFAV